MASAAGSPLDGAASPSADGWGAVAADSDEDLGAGDDAGDLLSDEELEDVPALAQRDLGPPDSSSSDDDDDDAPPEIDLDEAAADDAMNSALAAEYGGAQILAPSDNGAAAATAATTGAAGGQRMPAVPAVQPAQAPKIPRGKSPAHFAYKAGNLVFFDVDVEVGGPRCGIIQLSGIAHDQPGTCLGEFNVFVNPGPNAVWSTDPDACCHGLSATDPRIRNAPSLKEAWQQFTRWCEGLIPPEKQGVIAAWNGKSCDMEWFFKTTDIIFARDSSVHMPRGAPYFWDPMKTAKHYKECAIHTHCETHGYGLAEAYKACNPGAIEMPGAHNSAVDCREQANIVRKVIAGKRIIDLADRTHGIELLADVYKAKRLKYQRQQEESSRPVPAGWKENDPRPWKLPSAMNYEGGAGGPQAGPTMTGAESGVFNTITELFAKFLPDDTGSTHSSSRQRSSSGQISCNSIAAESNRYAKEWVKVVTYGTKKKKMFVRCDEEDPHARRRCGSRAWHDFTTQSVKVYLAICIEDDLSHVQYARFTFPLPAAGCAPYLTIYLPTPRWEGL